MEEPTVSPTTGIDIGLGIVVIITSLISLVFYLQILRIFYTYKNRFGTQAYRLMFQMGISDCLQLFFHCFGGIFSIARTDFNYVFNKICGGILNAAWIGSIFFTMLLAFNRFSALCLRQKSVAFENLMLFKFQVIFTWVYFGAFVIVYLTPYCSVIYVPLNFSWEYDGSDWSPVISKIEFYATACNLILTAILYLFIIFWITTTKNFDKTSTSREYRQEFRILIQAILISGYTGFSLVLWHTYSNYLPDSRYSTFTCNLVWIINGSVNPILYILMNNTIRQALLEKWRPGQMKKGTTVSIMESRMTVPRAQIPMIL